MSPTGFALTQQRLDALEKCGRAYAALGLAIAFTNGVSTEDQAFKKATNRWQEAQPLPDPEFAAALLKTRGATRNPILVLRASGLIGVDIDGPEGLAIARTLYGLPATVSVTTGRGTHLWFRAPEGTEKHKLQLAEGITWSTDGYFVCPPSYHAERDVDYRFCKDRAPWEIELAVFPPLLIEHLLALAIRQDEEERQQWNEPLTPGQRHRHMLRIGGAMRNAGAGEQAIYHALWDENVQRGMPPKPEPQVRALAHDIATRYQPTERKPMDPGQPVFHDLQQMQTRQVDWFDKPFLPWGELVVNSADGDTGKGLWSCWAAAKMTHLGGLVVFAVAEDAFETVLKPRLLAAEADLDYVRAVSWQRRGIPDALQIPDDIPKLRLALQQMGARFLVIDPLTSHLASSTDAYSDHHVKRALRSVTDLCHETGIVALGNHHFSKDRSRGARIATTGSAAFTNTPRVALAMARDDVDPAVRVIEVIKSNVGPKFVGRNFRIYTAPIDGLEDEQPFLVDEGPSMKPVDMLISQTKNPAVYGTPEPPAWDGPEPGSNVYQLHPDRWS